MILRQGPARRQSVKTWAEDNCRTISDTGEARCQNQEREMAVKNINAKARFVTGERDIYRGHIKDKESWILSHFKS